jgi:cytochrome P450
VQAIDFTCWYFTGVHIRDRVQLSLRPSSKGQGSQASAVPLDQVSQSGISHCPTGPVVKESTRSLLRQGQASLQAPSGPIGFAAAQVAAQFRQGVCPYLAQLKQGPRPDESALALLAQGQMDAQDFLRQVHKEHGPVVQMGDLLLESRVEAVTQILLQTENPHSDRFDKSSLQRNGLGEAFGQDNLFLVGDDSWRQKRALVVPYLMGPRVANEGKHQQIQSIISKHLKEWPEGEVEVSSRLRSLTLDVACQHMFSQSFSPDDLRQLAQDLGQTSSEAQRSLLGQQKLGALPLDKWSTRILQGRQAQDPRYQDLLQGLLDSGLSGSELHHEVQSLALLGHETTASWLTWTLAELAQQPKYQQAIHQEYQAKVGETAPTLSQTMELRQTRDVLRETLRLHPANYLLSREVKEEMPWTLADGSATTLKAGSQVLISLAEVHEQMEDEEWLPERDNSKVFSFGAGMRLCAGQMLARIEAVAILSQLVKNFEIQALPGSSELAGHSAGTSEPAQTTFQFKRR